MQTMRRLKIAIPLALAAAVPAAAETRYPIDPGYWETTSTVYSPLHSSKTVRRCIRPADIAKFLEGPGNHIYRCTYPTKEFHGGQIRLKGSCQSRDGAPFPIEGEGTYSRNAFRLEAHASAPFGPIHVPVRAGTEARRLGDACPAPEPAGTESAAAGNAAAGNAQEASPENAPETPTAGNATAGDASAGNAAAGNEPAPDVTP
jgi:hypothetical protein